MGLQEYYRTLSMPAVKSYLRCLMAALRDIHERKIIHRDVKPANFLFDPRTGIGTLCDFGLASVSYDPIARHRDVILMANSFSVWLQVANPVGSVCILVGRSSIRMDSIEHYQRRIKRMSEKCRRRPESNLQRHRTRLAT